MKFFYAYGPCGMDARWQVRRDVMRSGSPPVEQDDGEVVLDFLATREAASGLARRMNLSQ